MTTTNNFLPVCYCTILTTFLAMGLTNSTDAQTSKLQERYRFRYQGEELGLLYQSIPSLSEWNEWKFSEADMPLYILNQKSFNISTQLLNAMAQQDSAKTVKLHLYAERDSLHSLSDSAYVFVANKQTQRAQLFKTAYDDLAQINEHLSKSLTNCINVSESQLKRKTTNGLLYGILGGFISGMMAGVVLVHK